MAQVVGILADQGMPSLDVMRILNHATDSAEFVRDDEGNLLGRAQRGEIVVEAKLGEIPMDTEGNLELGTGGPRLLEEHGWDRLIYVTDLPLTAYNRPVLTQRDRDSDAWIVSSPTFGWWGAQRRLERELVSLIDGDGPVAGTENPRSRAHSQDDDDDVHTRVLDRPLRSWRLIAGTIRSNRPWRIPKVLTTAFAAMAASGGFGVFYGSIWQLADSMSYLRLFLVGVLAVVVFTGWIIVHNRMFVRADENHSAWRRNIDNISTFGTIAFAIGILYITIFLAMTGLTAMIVPADYMANYLSHDVSWLTYVSIGWLSASLGTFAGAIGSNFDETGAIQNATYSDREYERRARWGQF
ncbi:hypothetical protein ACXZ66_02130 [Corynebacterium sp. S7]